MAIVTNELELSTLGDAEVIDITEIVAQHRNRERRALVFVPAATARASVGFKPGLVQVLPAFFVRILSQQRVLIDFDKRAEHTRFEPC